MEIVTLQNRTARDWVKAVERDGFYRRKHGGFHNLYQHSDGRRLLLVYHKSGETFGPKTIRQLLQGTGWTEADLRRVGLL